MILGVVLFAGQAGFAGEEAPPTDERSGIFGRWIAGRLTFGARMTHFWLEDDRRPTDHGYDNLNLAGNFLGSLWGLDSRQHYFPNPFLEYRVISAFGAGIAYDQARAKTLDWGDVAQTITVGDGDVEIRGLQYYAFGRFRNRTRLTPYVNAGFAQYWSRFYVSPLWLLPGRRFVVDNTEGWFASAGGEIRLTRHLDLDALYRHSQTDAVIARAYFNARRHRSGSFPMRSDTASLGLLYRF